MLRLDKPTQTNQSTTATASCTTEANSVKQSGTCILVCSVYITVQSLELERRIWKKYRAVRKHLVRFNVVWNSPGQSDLMLSGVAPDSPIYVVWNGHVGQSDYWFLSDSRTVRPGQSDIGQSDYWFLTDSRTVRPGQSDVGQSGRLYKGPFPAFLG